MNYLLFILFGYLSGSMLFSYWLPLWLKKTDITQDTPDENPGVYNCVIKAGWPLGLLALCCDLLKGALPVFWACRTLDVEQWPFVLVVAAPVAGHAFSVFRRFRGGKAITVTFGVMLGLLPLWIPLGMLVASYLFFSLVSRVKPHRWRSIVTFVCFGLGCVVWLHGTFLSMGCLLAAGIVTYRHLEPEQEEEKASAQFMLGRRGR